MRARRVIPQVLAGCAALVFFPAAAAALDTATPAQPYLSFNPAAVGVSPAAAQQLTASFAVVGADTPTATIHYGYDYTAGAVTCTPNGGGQTCTVPVTFAPTLPGARRDALFLMEGTNLLATMYLGGVGQSPLALVQPGVATQLVAGATYEQSVSAVDENGTVYILSPNSPYGSNVYSVTKAGVVSVVPVNVIAPNVGIAIDGAGILYIASAAPGSSLITWNTVTQTQGAVSAALPPPYPCSAQSQDPEELAGAAVDAMGDVFTLDEVCQSVIEVKPNGTTVVTAIDPAMNADPFRIAVDSSGNLFFGCIDIINELLTNGNQSAITNPGDPESRGLAVDAADSLYVIPSPGSGIAELPASNYQSSQASLDPTANILGLGLGSNGTLYAGTSTTLDKVDRSQGAIAFGQQLTGVASAAQNVGLYNGGDEPLTISGIALIGAGSGFAIQAAAVNNCTEGLQLTPGEYCQVAVTLTPPHPGNFTGSIVFSTNSLNNTNSTETVALSGFVPGPYATLSPSPVAFANQNVGTTSAAITVTLISSGTLPLTTIGISITGTSPGAFSQTNACPATLQPTNSCTISVTFTPPIQGNYTASLSVNDNAGNSPQSVPLTGTGSVVQAVSIAEIVHVLDTPTAQLLAHSIAIAEIVHVIDTPSAQALAHNIAIAEIVYVIDTPTVASAIAINIAEVIHTADTVAEKSTSTLTKTLLSSSTNPSVAGQSVTFTATVSATTASAGTPTGTVQFSINGTSAGAPVTLNAAGQAVYSTAALADGASSITAAYSGGGSFVSSGSETLSQSVLDFAFTTSSSPSATVVPGQSATFQFAIAPQGAFGSTITFSASGLPPGAAASFDPASVTQATSASIVTMTIQTAPSSAALDAPWIWRTNSPLLLGILLPLSGILRARRRLKRRGLFLTTVFALGIAATLSGCGGGASFSQPQKTYTVTVTATSGALQHSTTVNLTVE